MYEYLADDHPNQQSQVISPTLAPGLAELMRAEVPLEGTSYGELYVVVVKPGGSGIPAHRHPEWVVLYYVEPANTPIIVDGVEILPEKDEMLVLAPNVEHSVPHNATDERRISIALKVPV